MPRDRLRILITPLNWGFGHAGRMIPVAATLRNMGHEVIIGADRSLLKHINAELPDIRLIEIKGLNIRYSSLIPQYVVVLLQTPVVLLRALKEHSALTVAIKRLQPDIIISDNRFACYNKKVFSVYVTHMLRIPFPSPFQFLERTGIFFHNRFIRKYNLCMVPDMEGELNLSGRLSHNIMPPVETLYMGLLSRFTLTDSNTAGTAPAKPYICLILSGPEPQKSLLMKKVAEATQQLHLHLVILSNDKTDECLSDKEYVEMITGKRSSALKTIIENSSLVVCRSGYTTLMELISLHKGAIIIPTPGQTEQEYLGSYLNGKYGFKTITQDQITKEIFLSFPEATETSYNNIFQGDKAEKALSVMLEKYYKRNGH